jgi:hypothetical protein
LAERAYTLHTQTVCNNSRNYAHFSGFFKMFADDLFDAIQHSFTDLVSLMPQLFVNLYFSFGQTKSSLLIGFNAVCL